MAERASTLTTIFTTAVIALAIDLLLVFPISHTSMIGAAVTKASGAVVVPPLDWFATNVLGMKSAAGTMAATGGSLSAAAIPPAIPTGVEGLVTPPAGPPLPTGTEGVVAPTPAAPVAPPIDNGTSYKSLTGMNYGPAANDGMFASDFSLAA
jgi:hypothetical protein